MEAVGLEAKRGKPALGKKPTKSELNRLYIKEYRSIREIADILCCSKDMVFRTLKDYGINRRSKTRKSQLRIYELNLLKKEVSNKGYMQVAAELGVGVTTLREYMRSKG